MKVEGYSKAVFKCPHCEHEHYFDQITALKIVPRAKWWKCSACGARVLVKARWLWGFSYEKIEAPTNEPSAPKLT